VANKSIVIYGPQQCGKTTNAEQLRETYRLDRVVDDWDGKDFEDEGVLYLTNLDATDLDLHLRHRRAHPYSTAMLAVRSDAP